MWRGVVQQRAERNQHSPEMDTREGSRSPWARGGHGKTLVKTAGWANTRVKSLDFVLGAGGAFEGLWVEIVMVRFTL